MASGKRYSVLCRLFASSCRLASHHQHHRHRSVLYCVSYRLEMGFLHLYKITTGPRNNRTPVP